MKTYIDFWHGETAAEADKIDIYFNPNSGEYLGNVYKAGKIIGDYTCSSSIELEKLFPQLVFNWGR